MTGKWIKWNGGDCPIKSNETKVAYKLRHGYVGFAYGTSLSWGHLGHAADIIGYRITEDHAPMTYTPLNEKLGHPLLDVFNAGEKARETGGTSGYPGNSLEYIVHAAGWVQRDLRLALDKLQGKPPMAQTREQIAAKIEALQKQLDAMPVVVRKYWDGQYCYGNDQFDATHYFDIETINGVPHIHGVAMKEVGK
jgi:hypothetical protein